MTGEPVLVMLVEDNADHAELVIRTLEEHRIANRCITFSMGNRRSTICSSAGNIPTLPKRHALT